MLGDWFVFEELKGFVEDMDHEFFVGGEFFGLEPGFQDGLKDGDEVD